jgi:hypothetical protein
MSSYGHGTRQRSIHGAGDLCLVASSLVRPGWALGALIAVFSLVAGATQAEEPLDFNRDVRPILSQNCFFCHGQDDARREAGLRLDTSTGASADLGGRVAVAPGNPEASELIARIFSDDGDVVMPPPSSHKELTADQKETLRRWIAEGARYDRHWAYVTPTRRPTPEGEEAIDYWVARRLAAAGLEFSPPADPHTWLRRVSLDLTGLPALPESTAAFLEDWEKRGDLAYGAAVDQLLDSPHFGERMAQEWLDVARYADTHGFNNDSARTMWPWRDWVIDSFNENKPYDQFLLEQLAGDLLPTPTLDQRIATGFSRNHVINSEGGIIDEEYRVEYVADRVRTTSTAWLGLTMECARCHSHKYDAITQRDYYGLFAFFNNVPEHGEDGRVANAAPMIAAPTKEQRRKKQQLNAEIAELDARLEEMRNSPAEVERPKAESLPSVGDAEWTLACESTDPIDGLVGFPDGPPMLIPGMIGQAWSSDVSRKWAELPAGKIDPNQPATLSFWIRPDADNPADVALFSSVDYSGERSQQGHGHGQEIRLIDGEIEIRYNDFFPAYALRVHTIGARVAPATWKHVAIVTGSEKQAVDVQVFIDGVEVETTTLYDGIHKTRQLAARATILGSERTSGAACFAGAFDEIRYDKRKLSAEELRRRFERDVLLAVESRPDEALTDDERAQVRSIALAASNVELRELKARRASLHERRLELLRRSPTAMVMVELPQPRPTFVLRRGQYDARGDAVAAGVPETSLFPWPENAPRNRLGLAQWLTHPEHPLTGRVVVNRFWAQLFGHGIVSTVEDFGAQGEYPTHPELLDHLTRDFIDGGWNVKALLRRIVLSRTYRQSSRVTPELLAIDPDNRLLARASRIRLPAETLRDQALFVAGLLSRKIGGPSVRPAQPAGLYDGLVVGADYPGTTWETSTGEDRFRRSLYTFWKRTVPHPVMSAFDVPDREVCTARRGRTNTPIQALILLNEPGFVEARRSLARRIHERPEADLRERLHWAFRLVLNRSPEPSELDTLLAFAPPDASSGPESWSSIATILLNLDETVTRE